MQSDMQPGTGHRLSEYMCFCYYMLPVPGKGRGLEDGLPPGQVMKCAMQDGKGKGKD